MQPHAANAGHAAHAKHAALAAHAAHAAHADSAGVRRRCSMPHLMIMLTCAGDAVSASYAALRSSRQCMMTHAGHFKTTTARVSAPDSQQCDKVRETM